MVGWSAIAGASWSCARSFVREGRMMAEAEGIFVRVSGERLEEMRRFYETSDPGWAAGRQTETMTSLQEGRP